ncbi:serine protease [Actinomadura sp. BRA 177]|uniref:trypsin-like serine peptidase n=1 Tax=Actinomadura sp. BRA 177 TaxID=2745202 RepID=UPI0015960B24|nr:serine protease [Actinomadura sp. BRA 177]NVI86610.1 trypsin-like peptidase domain-containing protein [Actinomadura sp. BRA 177]
MPRRLAAAALAVAAAGGTLTASTAQAAPVPHQGRAAVDFTGIVALSNCSGSLVRGPRSRDTDAALVLTNGHCLESGMPKSGEVVVDQPSSRTFRLLDRTGEGDLGTLRATRVEYATMTDTDVTVYRLNTTYAAIRQRYGVSALRLSTARPREGTEIRVVSGYWRTIYGCKIDATVYRLREAGWTWKDSIRYTPQCETIHGTSGSPVIDARTHHVVGVNNTGNDDGERCTLNNPCEVARDGRITVRHGTHYGQQTYQLARCLGKGNDVVLNRTCALPKP